MLDLLESMKRKNTPLKPIFICSETGVCRGIPNFIIFGPKQILWVLVRTASPGRLYVLSKNYKKIIKKKSIEIFNFIQLKKKSLYCMGMFL